MNSLTPTYRIQLNKNLLIYPQFIGFLRKEFHRLIANSVMEKSLNLEEKYKFTVYSIPVQWGNYIIPKIRLNEMLPEDKQDKKLVEIGEMLQQLDPLNPKPVELEFELGYIIQFVTANVKNYSELTSGGIQDYFGIETQLWFDDYPIQTGTVLKAVDYGTLDNMPKYLFNSAFMFLRENLMDIFSFFVNNIQVLNKDKNMVVNNADV